MKLLSIKQDNMNKQTTISAARQKTGLLSALENMGCKMLLADNSKLKEYNFGWRHLS
jgi:hypothetical protein